MTRSPLRSIVSWSRPGRRANALALACGFALLAACSDSSGGKAAASSAAPASGAAGLAPECADERVDYLLASLVRTEAFLADTSDLIPVLVSKLAHGQQDPLHQARTELGQLGAAALPELARFVEAQMSDVEGGPRLGNAFGALMSMQDAGAHALLARGLAHPQEAVRMNAIKGLVKHPDPGDYERLSALIPMSSPESQKLIAEALYASDQTRAEEDTLAWIADAKHPVMHAPMLLRLCEARRAELAPRIRAVLPRATEEQALWLRGTLAANGDADALGVLRTVLREGAGPQRTLAMEVLRRVELVRELVFVLEQDPEAVRRTLAAQQVSSAATEPDVRAALQRGIGDPVREVRKACLGALVATGDGNARDVALEMLKGDKQELEDALLILRDACAKEPALAERAYSVLVGLRQGAIQPLRVEPRTIDRAIAQMPLRSAAEVLYGAALEPGNDISRVSRHRWYVQMIGNTGAAGALLLREKWKTESDPVRRLDLVSSAIYAQDDAARDFLLLVLEDPRTTACEGLYVADRLVHFGPGRRMAPILKRYALRVDDRRVRPALNDLLWRWYGLDGAR